MTQRTYPYCLNALWSIPLAWVLALVVDIVTGMGASKYPGIDGGPDFSGLGALLYWAGMSGLAGALLSGLSLWRRERHPVPAWICLCLFFLPAIWGGMLICGFK